MLFHQRVLNSLNRSSMFTAANLSSAQILARGHEGVMALDFEDSYFANTTHKGSLYIFDRTDDSKYYHGVPIDKFQFVRTTNAYFVNSTGWYQLVSANTPRYDYNPTTLEFEGIMVEGLANNMLSNSVGLTGWTTAFANLVANSTTGPDKTVGMSKLVPNTSLGNHLVSFTMPVSVNSNVYVFSIFAKAAELSKIQLGVYESPTASRLYFANFDLAANAIITSAGQNSGNVHFVDMQKWSNGLYRLSVSGILGGTDTATQVRVVALDNTGATSFTGNGTDGIHIGYAQFELGECSSSFYPTGTTSLMRTGESLIMNVSHIPYNTSNGTFYAEARSRNLYANVASSNRTIHLYANDTTYVHFGRPLTPAFGNSRPSIDYVSSVGNSTVNTTINTSDITVEGRKHFKVATAYDGDNVDIALNGLNITRQTVSSPYPYITQLLFGGFSANGLGRAHAPMWIRKAAYYNRPLSNTEMREITKPETAKSHITANNYVSGVMSFDFTDTYFSALGTNKLGSVFITGDSFSNVFFATPDARMTFVRTTTASYVNSSGYIATANAGEMRYNYNPSTGELRGLLIERGITNYALQSGDQSNATIYTPGNTNVTANSVYSPDNTLTGVKIYEGSNNAVHTLVGTDIALAKNANATFSAFIKNANVDYVRLTLDAYNGNKLTADFNIANGTFISASNTGNATIANGAIEAYSNGWYRCYVTGIPDSTDANTGIQAGIQLMRNNTNTAYQGDGASSIYSWGWQDEPPFSVPTTYVPTTTATAARGNEACSLLLTQVPWNTSVGTVMVEFSRNDTTSAHYIYSIANSLNSSNYMNMVSGTANPAQHRFDVISGGTTQAQLIYTNALVQNQVYRMCATWGENNIRGYMKANGVSGNVIHDTAASIPEVNIFRIGGALVSNTAVTFMHYRKIVYVNTQMSNTELQTLMDST